MTNLKKLRVINLFIIVMMFGLLSCARAPHKSLFTDKIINENKEKNFPLIIVSDVNFSSPVLPQYLKKTKMEFPQTKFILLLTEQFKLNLLETHRALIEYFDASILLSPLSIELLPEALMKKPIINSHLYDIRNNERFLDKKTVPYLVLESDGQKILLMAAADFKLNPFLQPTDEDEVFRFFTLDPMSALLMARKELRKNPPQSIAIITTPNQQIIIDEKKHEYLNFTPLYLFESDYLLVKNNKIQLCEWFFIETDDCFQENENQAELTHKIPDSIISQRAELLEKNQMKKEATYMGEKIQFPLPSSTN